MTYIPRHISYPNKVRFVVRIEIEGRIAGDYVLYARTSKVALKRAEKIARELSSALQNYEGTWEANIIETPQGRRE